MNNDILRGMSRAFFASAYADQADEAGQSLQGEIMDQLPADIDPAARDAAKKLYSDFESALQGNSDHVTLDGAYVFLHGVSYMPGASNPEQYETFGHYVAMQAMGHGVGLFDYGVPDQLESKVPYLEFSGCDLSRDYFENDIVDILVYFRKFEDGDVIALWDDGYSSQWISSYQHIGQHSEASRELITELAIATPGEYGPLLKELESRGYRVTLAE